MGRGQENLYDFLYKIYYYFLFLKNKKFIQMNTYLSILHKIMKYYLKLG